MAKNRSTLKRARQNEKRRLRNRRYRTRAKKLTKKVLSTLKAGNLEEGKVQLRSAISALAKAASKGALHRRTASRRISRLTRKVNKISTPA